MDETLQTIQTRRIDSDEATELYVTATPQPGLPPDVQAERMFTAAAQVLRDAGAGILQERVFAAAEMFSRILPLRARAYGDLDDGVSPACLAVPENSTGKIVGVQLHAARSRPRPEPVSLGTAACGRVLRGDRCRFVALTGVAVPEAGGWAEQARAMLDRSLAALDQEGGDLSSVIRTWMWLGDILSWYDEFNEVRNGFFAEHKLIDDGSGRLRLPASTGIGVGPAGPGRCAMDLVAAVGAEDEIELLLTSPRQQPAYSYGSAFSRAARSRSPAGTTLHISGTASIDASGATVHAGDAARQIATTIDNVRAILDDQGCRDEDVLQAIVYCKTAEVERVFAESWTERMPWPQVVAIADICRDDLLFEVEAAAAIR